MPLCLRIIQALKRRLLVRDVTTRFLFRGKTFPDIPEIHPVQEQVYDYQGCKYQGCVIMHIQPLASWDIQVQ
jgi:hypothetical protein